jgi:hypothetical protein
MQRFMARLSQCTCNPHLSAARQPALRQHDVSRDFPAENAQDYHRIGQFR